MTDTVRYLIIAVVVACVAVWGCFKLYINANGGTGRWKIKKVLKKAARIGGGKLICDKSFNGVDFEYVVTGDFGVILAESFCRSGELYGSYKDDTLKYVVKKKTLRVSNFTKVTAAQTELLRKLFQDNKVYNVKNIYSFTVYTQKDLAIFINDMPGPLTYFKDFKKKVCQIQDHQMPGIDTGKLTSVVWDSLN